jgi:plasmid stabilization system protein ParE
MAKIIWRDNALQLLAQYIDNALIEFGKKAAKRWLTEKKNIEWRLERYPDSFPPEELLQGRTILHRRCHMMHRRFKLIYHYEETEDTVYVEDIWDTRMNPETLIRRIK